MNWSTFFTYLAQGGIVVVLVFLVGFVGSAVIAAVVEGIKGKRDEN